MLNKTWRIILLIVALLIAIWPGLIGAASQWIAVIAIVILLISEFMCGDKCMPMEEEMKSAPKRRKKAASRRRR